MENEQNRMIQAWANYICQTPFSQANFAPEARELIDRIFAAQLRGDSCIRTAQAEVTVLNDLVANASTMQETIAPFVFDAPYLYLYRYWALEHSIAQQIVRLKSASISAVSLQPEHLQLLQDPYQNAALKMVAEHALSMITGGPGTGKTYTLARIIAVLNQAIPNLRVAMAAPTGKAAQRMKEALMHALDDPALAEFSLKEQSLNPVTIHRLLGLGHRAVAKFNQQQALPYDVIVIDEASMLDLNLAQMLLAAVPAECRLILLGDAQQLASVDVGAVLADLQQLDQLAPNRTHLKNSRRFSDSALIGKMARFIQHEHPLASVNAQFEQAVVAPTKLGAVDLHQLDPDFIQLQYLPAAALGKLTELEYQDYYDQLILGFSSYIQALNQQQAQDFSLWVKDVLQRFDDYRILAAVRHGALGLDALNSQIELRLLKQTKQLKKGEWYLGRPVMMSYNDYQLGLSNGDIGICFFHEQHAQFEVYFPSLDKWVPATRLPKNIETAFALTIHKSQGSEFTHTAVVLDAPAQELLSKELIYTAITRAKKVVSLLVEPDAFAQALTHKTTRTSGLIQQIQQQFNVYTFNFV